ncbi:flavin-dependent oxidoreductase [Stigmatella sp. ncwal1]|uniref:Flavin-dependent oxidoreductase n=1 Tax=Stigmatella ashevillensis TaxID=2995309 RepID=A0ABT5DM98_9BACT|nr:flavin-dependent oxidoreductase [Stigmatella ashevillena]MDC0714790.1 flavin-dependent oxidoreductase [Stigmatella ashevillena]
MDVLIVGGGIGGLTTALSLHAAGISARVIEAVKEIKPLGVGINLLPHATRELFALELDEQLAAVGVPTKELIYFDRFGNRIVGEPRGIAAGYQWPQYSIHRGELQMLLLKAVHQRLGVGAVRMGLAFERFEQRGNRVVAEFRDVVTGRLVTETADVLIGADGIHSKVRAQLHPGEGRPVWNGVHMWRGVTEAPPFLTGRSMIIVGNNDHAKFVAYPISLSAEKQGRALVNWVAEVKKGGDLGEVSDWNRPGRIEDVLPYYADWHFECLDVAATIQQSSKILWYPMVDRNPLPWWSTGRVTLMGDAAHPMYPIGSNGGTQAIIDARVLAWHLARNEDPATALADYESVRRERTSALVLANRQTGPERFLRIVAERAPNGFSRIEDVMTQDELDTVARGYKRIAGFEVEALNQQPAWDVVQPPERHATATGRP